MGGIIFIGTYIGTVKLVLYDFPVLMKVVSKNLYVGSRILAVYHVLQIPTGNCSVVVIWQSCKTIAIFGNSDLYISSSSHHPSLSHSAHAFRTDSK